MKNYKLSMILCSIGIIASSLLLIMTSYAYFTVKINGEGKDIEVSTFDQNTNVVFTDTSNVSLVNAYTGDEIIKTFTIENTSDLDLYYDIVLKNVVNNFENKNDLVFTLESEEGANRHQGLLPEEDTKIASNILIKAKKTHSYKMTIKFLETSDDQSNNMNKTFSSNIMIEGSSINIGDTIYKDNTLLKHIMTNSNIEKSNIYSTNNSTNGVTAYYYKGNNETKNNLIYDNMCFRILRTDENYDIRLIYNGTLENGKCSDSKIVETTSFNEKNNYNAYVGYMYGTASSNNYKNEHANTNNSTIKTVIESWYKENIHNKTLISEKAVFCNYRKTNAFRLNGVLYANSGFGNTNSGYYIYGNIYPSYDCILENDRFSIFNNLTYPVGIITVDELLFAGYDYKNSNNDSFLSTSDNYWTMTSAYFNGSIAYNYSVVNNKIGIDNVSTKIGVRPIITINKDTIISSGDGSTENPFVVK